MGHPTDELTEAEKEVLRLYMTSSDPKQIAAAIGRSPHTVEARFKAARKRLGVGRTLDAAHMLAFAEGVPTYQTPVSLPLVDGEEATSPPIEVSPERGGLLSRLRPTRDRPWNAEPIWLRLLAMVGGVFALAAATLLCIAIAEGLTRIVRPTHEKALRTWQPIPPTSFHSPALPLRRASSIS